ncbi:WPP domain-associated protein [Tripterygium wilfordii]|uniref:WPP domain-associated protein n=1 Tax=Tripterygium wilfordii TaxID=458696 RepID=A0A7J7BYR8_TRIWF|nr:WPP domain-associated protein-like [Tripterygium wilfordii]KAF5727023.1 WPP domain-associated protein [Tripterygium wilfordii]
MGSEEALVDSAAMDSVISSCNDGTKQVNDNIMESENLEVDFVEHFDSYMQDISDRLTISRMVSDSVIRGMVNAVEQEAAEKIANKELEVAKLKEMLQVYHVGADENESLQSDVIFDEPKNISTISDTLMQHSRISNNLGSLGFSAKEQLKKLQKEIDCIKGNGSIRPINSGSELLGLGGILQDKASERWIDVDKMIDSLKINLESVFERVENVVRLSKASVCEWQLEKEFQAEIEGMVINNCFWGVKEEFEQKLWNQNAQFYCNENVNWHENIKGISSLCLELDNISKLLSLSETGQLTSHESSEITGDYFHWKASGNHAASAALHREGSGTHEDSTIVPENLDPAQLKHLSKDEIVNFFKSEMTKMKRHHESKVQEMTEEYFILKRDYLRERGSSLVLRKDKECEVLMKKIPEVMVKLDNFLRVNEKLLAFSTELLDKLKGRLEFLHVENRQLRASVTDKKKEIKCLSFHISDAEDKIAQHSLAEANLLKVIANIKASLEDANIEASICEDLHKCLFKELMGQTKYNAAESDMMYDIMQKTYETISRDVSFNAKSSVKYEIDDSDMEFILMQDLSGIIFREARKEAEEKFYELNVKYANETESRVSHEMQMMEREKALRLEVAEKTKLEQEILLLEASLVQKDVQVQGSTDALKKERQQFELVCHELDDLRDQTSLQQILLLETSIQSHVIKGNLSDVWEQIEQYKVEVCELKQKLELATNEVKELYEENRRHVDDVQEKHDALLMFEMKENEHKRQMETIIVLVKGLSEAVADLDCRITGDIRRINLGLENLSSELGPHVQKVYALKRMGSQYKQAFERRCSDLQKAEAEVDLLGDKADSLLNLLEKIYIALDHYSIVLQHYPGIMEILKLVKKELSGESRKPL